MDASVKKYKEENFNPDTFLESSILLLAILEANGEETRLAESTTHFFGKIYGVDDMQVYAAATTVSVSFEHEGRYYSANSRIDISKDFRKVSRVNRFVRRLSEDRANLSAVRRQLRKIQRDEIYYPAFVRYIGMFVASASLSFILGGTFADLLPGGLAGMLGVIANDYFDKKINVSFISEFIGGFVVAMVVYLLSRIGIEGSLYWSIFGGLMGLAPGSVLFSGFREMMTRQSSAGLTIIMQALFSALALGLGVFFAMEIFGINLVAYR